VGEERHKFHDTPVILERTGVPDEDPAQLEEFMENVERDFSGVAGDIIDNLRLSHLREKHRGPSV
jgi:hypothetical protein